MIVLDLNLRENIINYFCKYIFLINLSRPRIYYCVAYNINTHMSRSMTSSPEVLDMVADLVTDPLTVNDRIATKHVICVNDRLSARQYNPDKIGDWQVVSRELYDDDGFYVQTIHVLLDLKTLIPRL